MAFLDQSVEYLSADNRSRSPKLWKGLDWTKLKNDSEYGYCFDDDFLDLPTGKYTATQATAGTFALTSGKYGLAVANSGSTTNTQGINVQLPSLAFVPAAQGLIVFEAIGTFAANGTQPEFFCGLAASSTAIISSGAVSTSLALAGFYSSDSGTVKCIGNVASGTQSSTTLSSTYNLPTAGTYVKYGMRIFGTTKIEFFINGTKVATQTGNVPATAITPSLVVQSNGTTQPTFTMDRWTVAYVNRTYQK